MYAYYIVLRKGRLGGGGGVIRINYVYYSLFPKKVNKALSDKSSFFN
jgi:hypothetical protein